MLVANKREGANQVNPGKARTFAAQHGLGFAEVDLPSGSGVQDVFDDIISTLLSRIPGVPHHSPLRTCHSTAERCELLKRNEVL